MKLLFYLPLVIVFTMSSCKTQSTITLSGEFLYVDDAAVFKTPTEIYGVEKDKMMHQLNEKCKPFKKEKFDMIPVEVKATLKSNSNAGGWKEIITIKEIISVANTTKSKTKINIVKER